MVSLLPPGGMKTRSGNGFAQPPQVQESAHAAAKACGASLARIEIAASSSHIEAFAVCAQESLDCTRRPEGFWQLA